MYETNPKITFGIADACLRHCHVWSAGTGQGDFRQSGYRHLGWPVCRGIWSHTDQAPSYLCHFQMQCGRCILRYGLYLGDVRSVVSGKRQLLFLRHGRYGQWPFPRKAGKLEEEDLQFCHNLLYRQIECFGKNTQGLSFGRFQRYQNEYDLQLEEDQQFDDDGSADLCCAESLLAHPAEGQ